MEGNTFAVGQMNLLLNSESVTDYSRTSQPLYGLGGTSNHQVTRIGLDIGNFCDLFSSRKDTIFSEHERTDFSPLVMGPPHLLTLMGLFGELGDCFKSQFGSVGWHLLHWQESCI